MRSSSLVLEEAMSADHRSGCPINLTLEVVGDKWSLLIIRDMIFGNRRHFRELLLKSEEGIASNILADRMKRLVQQGIVTKRDDPSHKQKAIYSLTEQGIELLPILAQMAGWGHKYLPVSEELGIRAQLLGEGGPKMWAAFMDELRETSSWARRRDRHVVPSPPDCRPPMKRSWQSASRSPPRGGAPSLSAGGRQRHRIGRPALPAARSRGPPARSPSSGCRQSFPRRSPRA